MKNGIKIFVDMLRFSVFACVCLRMISQQIDVQALTDCPSVSVSDKKIPHYILEAMLSLDGLRLCHQIYVVYLRLQGKSGWQYENRTK